MTGLLLLAAFAVILVGALLFTNAVEWLGHRLELGGGAVGSVLAAVATRPLVFEFGQLVYSDPTGSNLRIRAVHEIRANRALVQMIEGLGGLRLLPSPAVGTLGPSPFDRCWPA